MKRTPDLEIVGLYKCMAVMGFDLVVLLLMPNPLKPLAHYGEPDAPSGLDD